MAASGARGARGSNGRRPVQRGAKASPPGASPRSPAPRAATAPPSPPPLPPGPFRLGAVEGATPGRWIDVWKERMAGIPLELVPLEIANQRAAVDEAAVDAALVRLPLDIEGLHVIRLYDEAPVVVCAADSHLTAADELTLDDLVDEVVITPRHPPLVVEVPGGLAPRFAPPATVGEAIAIAATGVGVVIVPMSLARLHHRKDVTHRPLRDAPDSPIALAWPRIAVETPPLVDAFIGIVRGRTARSSR